MKRSILPILLVLALSAQHAGAQQGAAVGALQTSSGSARSGARDLAPSVGSSYSSAESRTYITRANYNNSESPVSRSAPSRSSYLDNSYSGNSERGNYSAAYSRSSIDKNNLVNSHTNIYCNYVSKSGGFINNTARSLAHSTPYRNYTGVTSLVKTDTSGHCQPWSPLMEWLSYRRNQRYGISYMLPPEFTLSMFDPSPSFIASVEDYVVTDTRSPDMFTFFDGYIVYCRDTAYGLINLTASGVYFDGGDLQLMIPYKHQGLKAVVLFNDRNEELYLKRVGNDKILSRVLHDGKLLIYDCYYSFDKSNFSYESLSAAYRGREQRPLVMLDQRVHMIRTINRVYGSNLPSNYDWSAVVDHINTLD